MRKDFLANKTLIGKDNNISLNTYEYLSSIDSELYKIQINESFGNHKGLLLPNIPENIIEFRKIISDYISQVNIDTSESATWASQYDVDLINSFLDICKIKFKISIFDNKIPPLDYNFLKNYIYLYRFNDNHYQSILLL